MDPVRHSLDEISKDDTLGARVGGDVDVEPGFIGHAKHLTKKMVKRIIGKENASHREAESL